MTDTALGRLAPRPGQPTMKAVVTIGNGGYDQLVYCDVARPVPGPADMLIEVRAAGINNAEINTRLGWYSASVRDSTADTAQAAPTHKADGGWNEATPFPFIQGTDRCGIVVEVGSAAEPRLLGRRVLVRACMRPDGFASPENIWMARPRRRRSPKSSAHRPPRSSAAGWLNCVMSPPTATRGSRRGRGRHSGGFSGNDAWSTHSPWDHCGQWDQGTRPCS